LMIGTSPFTICFSLHYPLSLGRHSTRM
jgi:hypothetical protein